MGIPGLHFLEPGDEFLFDIERLQAAGVVDFVACVDLSKAGVVKGASAQVMAVEAKNLKQTLQAVSNQLSR